MPRSSGADRHLLLRAALRAYPPADRLGYGDELLEAALDLAAEESSELREAAGLVKGGLRARLARLRLGLSAVDLAAGLRHLTLPLAAFAVMLWGAAAVARMTGATLDGEYRGPTAGSVVLLVLLVLLVLGVARRQRGVATLAAGALLLQVGCSVLWRATRGAVLSAAPVVHLHLGSWWFGPGLIWSCVPLLMVLVAACSVMEPAAPRVPGLRRPWRERATVRAGVLLVPAGVLGVILAVAPRFVIDLGHETTELPGILYLILIVGSLWLAVTDEGERDGRSAAGALFGLAAVPSVAYGAARFAITPFRGAIDDRDTLIAIAAGMAVTFVVLALIFFAIVLAHVGLRLVDRRGGSALGVGHALDLDHDEPARAH